MVIERLKTAGLRVTKQRVSLARLLFSGEDRHVAAESFHQEATSAGIRVSLATVYNTLHQFTSVGLLRQLIVDGSKIYFDTNTSDHHHFYYADEARLVDIPADTIRVDGLPQTPDGQEVERVDVIVRLRDEPN